MVEQIFNRNSHLNWSEFLLSPFVDGFTDSMTPVSEVDPLGDVVLHAQRPPGLLPTRRQHPGEVDPPVSHA